MNKTHFEAVEELVKELGLPEGFYAELLGEDDWSFIIKLHALMEAAVTGLIVAALGHFQCWDEPKGIHCSV